MLKVKVINHKIEQRGIKQIDTTPRGNEPGDALRFARPLGSIPLLSNGSPLDVEKPVPTPRP